MEVIRARCSLSTLKKQSMLFIVVLSLKEKKKKRPNSEFGRLPVLSEAGKPSQGWRKKWLRILRLWGFRITRPGCALPRTYSAYFHRPLVHLSESQTNGFRFSVWENVFFFFFFFSLSVFPCSFFFFPLFSSLPPSFCLFSLLSSFL